MSIGRRTVQLTVRLVHERALRPFAVTRSFMLAVPSPPSAVSVPRTTNVVVLRTPTNGLRVTSPRSVKLPSAASGASPLIVPRPQLA